MRSHRDLRGRACASRRDRGSCAPLAAAPAVDAPDMKEIRMQTRISRAAAGLALAVTLASGAAHATQVIDTFDDGANPNGWRWVYGNDGLGTIEADGGNPGGWLDSTSSYWASRASVYASPAPGTALRDALDSGELRSVSIDWIKFDVHAETMCGPPGGGTAFSIMLIDNQGYTAWINNGPAEPNTITFPWTSATFAIPPASTTPPDGWTFNTPPDNPDYTWSDFLHNLSTMTILALSPDVITFSACWHMGVDNIVVSYGADDHDPVFANGFDPAARGGTDR
jgi:hypothetical protein